MVLPIRGKKPKIHSSVFIAESADVIGDVEIGKDSSVWFNAVVRGDVNSIRIGEQTNIQDNCCLHGTYERFPVNLGNGITVGHSVTLHGCTIEDYVLIGMGATILDGAVVGKESLVAAGALVTQGSKIPPRSLVMGSPAKVVRSLTEEEIQKIYASAERYKMYIGWYRAEPVYKKCFQKTEIKKSVQLKKKGKKK